MAVSGFITRPDGATGCPVDICRAVCCRVYGWPDLDERCRWLRDDFLCEIEASHGKQCKPHRCYVFPVTDRDVAWVNERAERFGFNERCLLKVVSE